MKTFKQIKEEIANVSAGYGVRGFGDISGTPKVGEDDDQYNPHIERVIQGAEENNALVKQFVQNSTDGMHTFDDDNWWKDRKEIEKHVTSNITKGAGLDFDNVKRGIKVKSIIKEEGFAGMSGTVGANRVSGYVAGLGIGDQGEPPVHPRYQAKYKLFSRAAPGEVGTPMKEIPIQEVKRGMFAGEQTFIVPSHVFEKALHSKRKHKHWRTYIQDEMFHPAIREFAYSKIDSPIIFEDEKTGYMYYARYGRKKRKK